MLITTAMVDAVWTTLTTGGGGHTQRHAAYPIIHYFHSPQRRTAASPKLAVLDEALLKMATAVDPEVRLSEASIAPARAPAASPSDGRATSF